MSGEERWCAVTGGRGFAARHLVEMLIKYQMFAVRIADSPSIIDLQPYVENGLLGEALRSARAHYVSTDLSHEAQLWKELRLLVPSLVSAARAGKSKFIIGNGDNVYDFTYVENVAHAHICAERALASGGEVAEKAAERAYFVTNMEPIKFWEFVS